MRSRSTTQRSPALVRFMKWGVITYVLLLVVAPLVTLVAHGLRQGLTKAMNHLASPVVRDALTLTLSTAALVGAINVVFGTAIAWVLVRYRLRGRAVLSALIDLPLAIPTLVAGVMLVVLYGPTSLVGSVLEGAGFRVIFAKPAIVLALLFVTLPFVVRAVEPVLEQIDPDEEEAATVLGAGLWKTFRTVFFPTLLPVSLSGGVRAAGRALGEFGSVVVVAGNIPRKTLTAPVWIFGEIESGAPEAAAVLSVVLLACALLLGALPWWIERRMGWSYGTS